MSAPLARGIIIAASVVVAAGIAIMENEQVRRWLDEHRRRIAIALYSLGDGINPSMCENESSEQQAEMEQISRQRRHEIVRRNREELIRRAREQGTSVDLDELTALGMLEKEAEEDMRNSQQMPSAPWSDGNIGFDHLVGHDGKLRLQAQCNSMNPSESTKATALSPADESGLRHRSTGARGFASGSAFAANPFGDEMALHDDDALEITSDAINRDTAQTGSLAGQRVSEQLDLLTPMIREIPIMEVEPMEYQPAPEFKTEDELNAEIEEAIRRSLEVNSAQLVDAFSPAATSQTMDDRSATSTPHSLADSLFGPPSPRSGYASAIQSARSGPEVSMASSPTAVVPSASPIGSFYSANGEVTTIDAYYYDGDRTPMGSGTLTPTDDAFSTISSMSGDREAELVNLDDVRSQADTNDSFSVVGASTPGTWSEVGSDDGSDVGDGQVNQPQR